MTDLLICWGDGLWLITVRVITSRSVLKCGIVRLVSEQFDHHYREYWSHITLAISRWRSPKKLNCRTVGGQFCFFIQSKTFHHSNFIHYIKLFNKVCSLLIDAKKKYESEFKIRYLNRHRCQSKAKQLWKYVTHSFCQSWFLTFSHVSCVDLPVNHIWKLYIGPLRDCVTFVFCLNLNASLSVKVSI